MADHSLDAEGWPRGLDAWLGLLDTQAALQRLLEEELVTAHRLPLSEFRVLYRLAEATDAPLRIADLAARTGLSASHLSRVVERFVRAGQIERQVSAAGLPLSIAAGGRRAGRCRGRGRSGRRRSSPWSTS